MRRYDSSGERTTSLSGIIGARGIARPMIMARRGQGIVWLVWGRRRIWIWGVVEGGRRWVGGEEEKKKERSVMLLHRCRKLVAVNAVKQKIM
jgi:hypothetical protein